MYVLDINHKVNKKSKKVKKYIEISNVKKYVINQKKVWKNDSKTWIVPKIYMPWKIIGVLLYYLHKFFKGEENIQGVLW